MRGGALAFGVGAIALLLAALPNCSSDDDGGDLCSQYYDALISYDQRCQSGSRAGLLNAQRARFLTVCAYTVSAPGAGTVTQGLTDCVGKVANGSCNESNECDVDTVGSLPVGTACLSGYQCASGACDSEDGNCGHCVARGAVGQPCDTKNRCVDDATCNITSGNSGTCVAIVRMTVGQSCKPSSTSSPVVCDKGLYCNYDDIQNPVCQTPGLAGAKCNSDSDCDATVTCKDRVCSAPSGVGGPCSDGDGCARGLLCDADKCVAVTYVANGQPCDNTHDCLNGHCKIADGDVSGVRAGTCEPYLADGAACTEDSGNGGDPARCDAYAECTQGTCQVPNPANCK